jgi:hypothetical protein
MNLKIFSFWLCKPQLVPAKKDLTPPSRTKSQMNAEEKGKRRRRRRS